MTTTIRKTFELDVLTPLGRICRIETASVVFPSLDGMLGILPGRSPLIAAIGTGQLRVQAPDGQEESFYVSGGFAHVRENRMTVLADQCAPAAELNPEECWAELQDAAALPGKTDEQRIICEEALLIARAKFSIAQRHRRKSVRESSTSKPV